MKNKKPTPKQPDAEKKAKAPKEQEIGGFGEKGNKMPEPTRFGDWEVKGRCSDF